MRERYRRRHDESTTDVIHGTLDVLILKTLSPEPMHGLGIARRVVLVFGRRRLQALDRRRGSRYSTGMKLAFELPPAQADRLREEAKRLGLAPEDLARAALTDLLGTPDAEFRAAAARILQKNQELYRRLA